MTFFLKRNRLLKFLTNTLDSSRLAVTAADKTAQLAHTLMTVSHNIPSFSTGETRTIKFHFTCNTKNFIYMIQCNRCNLQYIGETKRRLKDTDLMSIAELSITLTIHLGLPKFLNTFFLIPITLLLICN